MAASNTLYLLIVLCFGLSVLSIVVFHQEMPFDIALGLTFVLFVVRIFRGDD